MNKETKLWQGQYGYDYTKRTTRFANHKYLDTDRITIFKSFFEDFPRDMSILEAGCNRGNSIQLLYDMGFSNITGIDINKTAIDQAKRIFPKYTFINTPYEDFEGSFDMVYTCGLLIHISDIKKAVEKVKSLTKKYIFGNEYYSDEIKSIDYHVPCYSCNYPKLFNMKNVRTEIYEMKENTNSPQHIFYLLRK